MISMRPKSTNKDLPPRMIRRSKTLKSGRVWVSYYYNGYKDGKRYEIPLGTDLDEAKLKWAQLEQKPINKAITMNVVFNRYIKEVLPTKAKNTQESQLMNLNRYLIPFFGNAPIDAIEPMHVAQYRDKRKGATGVNNEIGLFSHAFNMAREWGYTNSENPTRGIRRIKLKPRDNLITKETWDAVYNSASDAIKDCMDLAYITGQRISDVLSFKYSDIRNDALEIKQQKTSKKLRILIEKDGAKTALGEIIERIKSRKRKIIPLTLVATKKGKQLNYRTFATYFSKVKDMAITLHPELKEQIENFQFRDIRALTASSTDNLEDAQKLLGHTKEQITKTVYRRIGETVEPLKKIR